jgi:two-component system sensor histidine kinase AlgZ
MIDVALPKKTLIINHDLRQHMNFYIQADRLRAHFGQSADIQSSVASTQIITIIDYPLQDVGL